MRRGRRSATSPARPPSPFDQERKAMRPRSERDDLADILVGIAQGRKRRAVRRQSGIAVRTMIADCSVPTFIGRRVNARVLDALGRGLLAPCLRPGIVLTRLRCRHGSPQERRRAQQSTGQSLHKSIPPLTTNICSSNLSVRKGVSGRSSAGLAGKPAMAAKPTIWCLDGADPGTGPG